ncbi:MAG TPA: flagellar basal body P-ring protein FlgI [Phycisphaerales bacterium]|nr:flagellar basal body P-ring protein FlgI [Phycisphaerales bacterium]
MFAWKHVANPLLRGVCAAVFALSAASAASGTSVQDLVRIKGQERNVLTGLGIVIGLNGTGDTSKDSYIAARPYAELLKNLGNPVASLDELAKADAYALVDVRMEIPAVGVREGDRISVTVSTLYNAKSLNGGMLVVSPLRLPRPDSPDLVPMAYAEGPIVIEGTNPRNGVVRDGGQMLTDIRTNPVTPSGSMGLVLKDQYAGYPVATTIASAINEEFAVNGFSELASVEDGKNIKVLLPPADRASPATFIANLMMIPIDPSLIQVEARVVINEKQGIIVVTGNVQIGPVGISHGDLTIASLAPPPVVDPNNPNAPPPPEPTSWRALDTTDHHGRNSTRLVELLEALKMLNVSVQDQIAIVYELRKTGALHAEIVKE